MQGPETAKVVRMRDGAISATDGPFAETKEQLGGFFVIEAATLDEAIEIAGHIPSARLGSIELRPVRDVRAGAAPTAAAELRRRCRDRGAKQRVEAVYRAESRRVLATLIRLLGDFDLAEEALHDAFVAAAEQWPRDGMPANPRAWLVSAGRFKAIDRLRRRARFDAAAPELAARIEADASDAMDETDETIADDQLAADLHLLPPGAAARRPGRADPARGLRADDRGDRPRLPHPRRRPWPSGSCGPRRRSATRAFPTRSRAPTNCRSGSRPCCKSIYLVFNEGYSASSGEALTRPDLSAEAIRLGRLLADLLPEPEAADCSP